MIKLTKVFIFGNDVDTDTIAPGGYLHLPLESQKKHCLESVYPGFSDSVREGDIIVAGENFGNGSSREQAPLLLKSLGIRAVFAKSFSRLFFRNAINIGLFPGIIKGECILKDQDEIVIDMDKNRIISDTLEMDFSSPEGIAVEILNSGGMIEFARKMLERN